MNFRRKNGAPVCVRPGGDGRTLPSTGGESSQCEKFSPRRSCTTCEYRCSPEDKYERVGSGRKCQKWKLRAISTWGGSKYRAARMRTSEADVQPPPNNENKE